MSLLLRMILLLVTLLLPVSSARAMDPVQLTGEYQLAGRLDHNGATTPGKSHLYISLTDGAAKALYKSLGGDPVDDPCTGYTVKAQGNVGCYEMVPNEQYFCSFSVNLERGAVEAGLGGCF